MSDEPRSDPASDDDASDDDFGEGATPVSAIVARVLLVVVLVGGPILLASVAYDLFAVRGSLQEARSALAEVRGSIGDVDIEAASGPLEVANEELDDAESRAGRFTWSVARFAPFVGPSVDVSRDVVDVASAAVDIATIAVSDGQALLDEGLDIEVVDGRIDLGPVLDARSVMDALPIDRLASARDALATPRDRWLPEVIVDGRADTLQLADETLTTVTRTRAVTDALPTFLGSEGQRRYFVGLQTPAELRGTGGLIGYWGVLEFDDGQVTYLQSAVQDAEDTIAEATDGPADGGGGDPGAASGDDPRRSMKLSFESPPDVDPEFLSRYAVVSAARSLPNINLDPDLPTTSKAILDLYELNNDEVLDGVILLDPVGLQEMLGATGSTLPLSEELRTAFELPDGLPTDRFAQFVTADIYATYGADFKQDRDDALQEIGDAALERIFSGAWESATMLRAVAWGASEKHVQVFTRDEQAQAAFVDVGTAGALSDPDGADLYAVTANNAVGGKQDVHLGHAFSLDVTLGDVYDDDGSLAAGRTARIETTVDNPLPSSGMDEYIIGSCYVPGGFAECFEGNPGENRTWFSVWTGLDNTPVGFATGAEDARTPLLGKQFRGLHVLDYFLLTPSQQQRAFTVETSGIVPLTRTTGSVVYELAWWRQAKAIPDLLDVRIAPPDGWDVDRIEVVGAGEGRGSGVHGEGRDIASEVDGGAAVVTGTVTADTRIRVHLVAADDA